MSIKYLFFYRHHKIDSKSLVNKLNNQYVVDLETYLNLYELVNDKILIQNKETAQKLKTSFQHLRILFLNSLSSDETGQNFEDLLFNIPAEVSPKQTEVNLKQPRLVYNVFSFNFLKTSSWNY